MSRTLSALLGAYVGIVVVQNRSEQVPRLPTPVEIYNIGVDQAIAAKVFVEKKYAEFSGGDKNKKN